jgi:hypothetical protein
MMIATDKTMANIMLRLSITRAAPSSSVTRGGGHRVVTAFAPRVATGEALDGKPAAAPGTEAGDGLDGVS